jgi:hypothetical protein
MFPLILFKYLLNTYLRYRILIDLRKVILAQSLGGGSAHEFWMGKEIPHRLTFEFTGSAPTRDGSRRKSHPVPKHW